MNPDTGEIRDFESDEQAKKEGFTVPIPEHLVEELRALNTHARKQRVAELLAAGELPSMQDMVSNMSPEELAELERATNDVKAHTKNLRGGGEVEMGKVIAALDQITTKKPAGNSEKLIGKRGHGHTHLDSPPYQSPHKGSKKSTPATRAKRAKRKAQRASRKRNR